MSEKTNSLLKLFSKVLMQPQVMMAVRMEMMSQHFKKGGDRMGSRGLLIKLWERDGLTNSEIAELLDIRPSSVTAQVKDLEGRGYVERKQDENDGRVSRIFLTEEGRQLKDKRTEHKDNVSEELFQALSEEEQLQLAELLEKLSADWSENESFNWMNMSREDWKAMRPEDRRAMKEEVKKGMKQMKAEMRGQMNEAADWFGDRRPGAGFGRPNGDFMGWVRGPRDMKDYPDWRERHFGDEGPAQKKKDEKGWDDF